MKENTITVYEKDLPEIFETIYYYFLKTNLIKLNKSTYKAYEFYLKLKSKEKFSENIKAIYEVYCDDGCPWELNIFKQHFILSEIESINYNILAIKNEKIDFSNNPKMTIIIKYAEEL